MVLILTVKDDRQLDVILWSYKYMIIEKNIKIQSRFFFLYVVKEFVVCLFVFKPKQLK